jgi:hypothetical protein
LWRPQYYSMLYLRSLLAIRFFPRVTLLYFLMFHLYFFSTPYGFFGEFLLGTFLLMLHAMLYSVLYLELPACQRGDVSFEQPRYAPPGETCWSEGPLCTPKWWGSEVGPVAPRELVLPACGLTPWGISVSAGPSIPSWRRRHGHRRFHPPGRSSWR